MKKYFLNESNKKYFLREDVQARDWTQELKAVATNDSSEFDELYDEYLDEYWGNENREIINRLGEALSTELTKFGYTEEENPFVYFLHTNNCARLKWFADATTRYQYLHNGAANGEIREDDIRGTGFFGLKHLIFFKKAFTVNEKTFDLYLNILDILKSQSQSSSLDKETEVQFTSIFFKDKILDEAHLITDYMTLRNAWAGFGKIAKEKKSVGLEMLLNLWRGRDVNILMNLILDSLSFGADESTYIAKSELLKEIGTKQEYSKNADIDKAWIKVSSHFKLKDQNLLNDLSVYLYNQNKNQMSDDIKKKIEDLVNAFFNSLK